MSPFATWPISCPSTARTSSGRMFSSRPVLTATSALFLLAPVANAFGCGDCEHRHFRHADAGFLGQIFDRIDEPALGLIARFAR